VLDGVGGEIGRAAFAVTAAGGVFSAHGAASGDFTPLDADTAREGGITVRGISDVQFSPEQDAAEAHRRIEAREVVGKSLLLVSGKSNG
jgi:NADPH2:quinone reductase